MKKIVRSGAGAALLQNLGRAEQCLAALRKAVRGTLSIKIRSGWDEESVNCLEVGRLATGCGVDLITLHPRTRKQGYSGRADWSLVEALANTVSTPVVGNGDLASAEEALQKVRETCCAGVMIGRAALVRPWIFREAEVLFRGEVPGPPPAAAEIGQDLCRQLSDLIQSKGERVATMEMRKFLAWASKGMGGAAAFRRRSQGTADGASLRDQIEGFFGICETPTRNPPEGDRSMGRVRVDGFV